MTDERSGVHLGRLDLGSGFALWVSEMIQDRKQQFSRGVAFFWGCLDLLSE
jgi:hypothetical protein